MFVVFDLYEALINIVVDGALHINIIYIIYINIIIRQYEILLYIIYIIILIRPLHKILFI